MIFGDSKNDLCLNKRVHIFEVVLDKGYSLGITSQQASEHGRILILRVNLAFVRIKALLATVLFFEKAIWKLFIRIANRVAVLYNWFNRIATKIGRTVRFLGSTVEMLHRRQSGGTA